MPFDSEISAPSRDRLILQRARDRLAEGWCQGQTRDIYDNVCAIGALNFAKHGSPDTPELYNYEYEAYEKVLDIKPIERGPGWALATFNNAPGRTLPEVLALFDAAIARLP